MGSGARGRERGWRDLKRQRAERSLAAYHVMSCCSVDRDIFLYGAVEENFKNENEKSPFMNLPMLVWISPNNNKWHYVNSLGLFRGVSD